MLVSWARNSVVGRADYARSTLGLILGRLPGLLIPIASARIFGATGETDAFFFAWALVSYYLGCWAAAVEVVSVPFLVRLRQGGRGPGAYLKVVRRWCTLTCAGYMVGAMLLVKLGVLAPGGADPVGTTVLDYLFLLSIHALFSAHSSIEVGLLVSIGRYGVAFMSSAISTVIALAGAVLLGRHAGVWALAGGYPIGELVRLAFLKSHARWTWREETPGTLLPSEVRTLFSASSFQVLGSILLGSYPVLDRMWASHLGEGAISFLSYAERLWMVPVGLATGGILSVKLVEWSESFGSVGSAAMMRHRTRRLAVKAFMIGLIVATGVGLMRRPLASFLFQTGALDPGAVQELGRVLAALMAGLPLYLMGVLYARGIQVLGKTHYLLMIAVVQLGTKSVLNAWLSERWGVAGLALSTTGMYAVGGILAAVCFRLGCSGMSDGRLPRGEAKTGG